MVVEKTYKKGGGWFLDLVNTAASLLKVWLRSKKAPILPAAQGEKLLVLGTGPSLKQSLAHSQAYFESTPVMCVNTFCLTEEFTSIKPRYYVMMDPGLWHGDNELVKKTLDSLILKTTWQMHVMIPHDAKNTQLARRMQRENPNLQLHFLNYIVFKGFASVAGYFFRRNKAMPQSQNVLVAALFLAVNLGYRRIELFGADHNWHEQLAVDPDNIVCMKHVHFYEDEQQLKLVPFWKAIHIHETFRMDEIFHAWAKVFQGYVFLQKYALGQGSKIVNRSAVSFIDAFEREKF